MDYYKTQYKKGTLIALQAQTVIVEKCNRTQAPDSLMDTLNTCNKVVELETHKAQENKFAIQYKREKNNDVKNMNQDVRARVHIQSPLRQDVKSWLFKFT